MTERLLTGFTGEIASKGRMLELQFSNPANALQTLRCKEQSD
jgi:hypothetical protein